LLCRDLHFEISHAGSKLTHGRSIENQPIAKLRSRIPVIVRGECVAATRGAVNLSGVMEIPSRA
jgi:hypothetical protein